MKVKVLGTFRDKYTRILYGSGAILDITPERADEMNGGPAGVLVEIAQEPADIATEAMLIPAMDTESEPEHAPIAETVPEPSPAAETPGKLPRKKKVE